MVIADAKAFSRYVERIRRDQPIAFPCGINPDGTLNANTSLLYNVSKLDKINAKNYIWRPWTATFGTDVDNEDIPTLADFKE